MNFSNPGGGPASFGPQSFEEQVAASKRTFQEQAAAAQQVFKQQVEANETMREKMFKERGSKPAGESADDFASFKKARQAERAAAQNFPPTGDPLFDQKTKVFWEAETKKGEAVINEMKRNMAGDPFNLRGEGWTGSAPGAEQGYSRENASSTTGQSNNYNVPPENAGDKAKAESFRDFGINQADVNIIRHPTAPLSDEQLKGYAKNVMGVPDGGDKEAVKAAYRRLSKEWYPDKEENRGDLVKEEKFATLSRLWEKYRKRFG